MAKHGSMHKLLPFKSWKDAADEFEKMVTDIIDNVDDIARPGLIIGVKLMQFQFRLGLTAENERRKKR